MPKPGLIITADDYGLNEAINKGIIEGVQNGVVTSVHVLPNFVNQDDIDRLKNVVTIARNNGHSVGIGLHLNTTYGPAMIDEETNFKRKDEGVKSWPGTYAYKGMNRYNRKKTVLAEMEEELTAQFDYLSELLGDEPIDAISSHTNMHLWDEEFLPHIIQLAQSDNIPIRSQIRWTTKEQNPQPPHYYKAFKGTRPLVLTARKYLDTIDAPKTAGLMLTPLDHEKLEDRYGAVKTAGLKSSRNSSGHWFGQPSTKAMTWFMSCLPNMNVSNDGYTSEIFMHLSSTKSKAYGDHRWDYKIKKRYEEYKTITDEDFLEEFKKGIEEHQIRLGSYRDLLL